MTSATSPWSQGRNPGWDAFASRLSHYTAWIWLSVIPLFYLTNPRLILGENPPFWPSLLLALPTALVLAIAIMVDYWHVYAMCPVCARKVPIDPEAKIKKHHWKLATIHWAAEKHAKTYSRVSWGLIILSFVPHFGLHIVGFILVFLLRAFMGWMLIVHYPLTPWCPYCRGRWGDGGEEEKTPNPDPSMTQEKV